MTRTPPDPKPGARYFADARTWAEDQLERRETMARWAWRAAAGAGLVAVLEAFALAALAPLKTVVPYTLTVDRQTGYVETVRGVKLGPLSENEAVTHAFLAQYVMARETFDAADLNANYQKVAAWSRDRARASYLHDFDRGNPRAVLVTTPPTSVISVRVKSISMLSKTTGLVRFDTERQDANQLEPRTQAWTAVVAFRRDGAPTRMQDRLINPLGFQVTSYRRDAETAPTDAYVRGTAP